MRMDVYAVAEAERLAFGHPPTLAEFAAPIQFALAKGIGDKEAGIDGMPPRLAEVLRIGHKHKAGILFVEGAAIIHPIGLCCANSFEI